jgi:DNA-binding MarR family transcriptional regulator
MIAVGLAAADDDSVAMTAAGRARLAAARDRKGRTHRDMLTGIDEDEYAKTIDVLRRIVGNLGGDSHLP